VNPGTKGAGRQAAMSDAEKVSTKLSSLRKTMRKLSEQIPKSDTSYQRKLSQYEDEIEALQAQVKSLEEEIYHLRRRLTKPQRSSSFSIQA
jgi:predicted  nucleic acid-binding Zn-ribbon protein